MDNFNTLILKSRGQYNRYLSQSLFKHTFVATQVAVLLGLTTAHTLCIPLAHAEIMNNFAVVQKNVRTGEIHTLPSIKVKATKNEIYAGGQVASSSNIGFLGQKSFMETPFNTTGYDEKYVADKQAQNIADVIAKTDPSVFTNGASGGWSENYYIRGLPSSPNDMSMNGLFGITPFYRTSPEMFERVEVLKGPSALLNGMPPAGSVGGTVNLQTKYADEEPLTRFTTTYMSDAQFGGHLDVGRRFGYDKEYGVRANAVYRDGKGAVNDQDKENALFSLGMDWRGENARIFVDAYSASDRVDGVNRGINVSEQTGIPKPPKADSLLNPDWGFVESKDRGAMLRGEYDLNDHVMAYVIYGQSHTKYKYNGAMSAELLDPKGNYLTKMGQLAFEVDKKSTDAGLKGNFETGQIKHQWAINATYYKHDQDDHGVRNVQGADWTTNLYDPIWQSAPPFNPPPISHSMLQLNSYGLADTLLFAQDRIQLTLGARYQEVKNSSLMLIPEPTLNKYKKNATTPGIALLVKATDNVSVYANYIEGLTKGGKAPSTAVNSGTILPPLKTKQMELGVKLDQGTFAHTLAVFEIKQPNNYLDSATNYYSANGEQRNRGVEWSFFGSPIENVHLMGGVTYLQPKLTHTDTGKNDGRIAQGVPQKQAKLGVEWDTQVGVGTLTLSGNMSAVSKQYINQQNTLSVPGHTLFDVGARYRIEVSDHPVTVRTGIYNLTNKAYWGMPQLSNLVLGAPRTYMLSVTYDF